MTIQFWQFLFVLFSVFHVIVYDNLEYNNASAVV